MPDLCKKVAWDYGVSPDNVSIVRQREDIGSGDYDLEIQGIGKVKYTRMGTVYMAAPGNPTPKTSYGSV